jgi:hypothetical protein
MFKRQETRLGVTVAWILAPLAGAAVGFYFGTIWATPSVIDLRIRDIDFGFQTALIGLLGGLLFAIGVTVFYPPVIEREYRLEEEAAHH